MRPAHKLDFADVGKLLGPEAGSHNVEMGEILVFLVDWDLVARSMVSKAPQITEKVRTELAKRV